MESENNPFDDKMKNLEEVIVKFLQVSSANDARQILEQHPELLSEEADAMLDTLFMGTQDKENIINLIQNYRNFLARYREVGIEQTLEEILSFSNASNEMPEDLRNILDEIDILSSPQEVPRKITIIQHALSLIQIQSNPELWAYLQVDLGNSVYQNPHGNRAENIEQAIEHYNQALKVRTYDNFPMDWAETQNNLGIAYWSRILGDEAENIEQALEHYNQALKVYTYYSFPMDWAETQNNLGIAYWSRILGDKAENIEQAIEHYNYALEVYTHQDFPVEWARTQHNLASAYSARIMGNKAENIEKAIEHYNQSLEVRTRKDFPMNWAGTQNNLANAYWSRIRGDKAENIEQAIEHYNHALEVYNQKDFPVDWAMIQDSLALAYWIRIRGDKAENIEQAIELYNQALEVRTQKNFPVHWAMTQTNLGMAYDDRIRGDKAENIEQAIKHHNQALTVLTQKDFQMQWALTQNSLAAAYSNRIRGDKTENIEQAIKHFNHALEVYNQKDFSMDWAMTQNNLAAAYWSRIRGDKIENLEKAIEYYNQALKIRTHDDLPVDWAMTQYNLATAYWSRISGDRAKNVEKAIEHCNHALEIYELGSIPNYFLRTCRLLGDLYLDMNQWDYAFKNYKDAINADDLLYSSGLSAESKAFEVEENVYIYQNASFTASRLGLAQDALVILEGGKTRLLSEALRLRMKRPENVPENEWMGYKQAAEQYRTATKSSGIKKDYAQWEKDVKENLKKLDDSRKVVQEYEPNFQKELDVSDILPIADKETALLTFCITDKGSVGFVVSKSGGIQSVDIPGFKKKDLDDLLFKPDEQRYITGGWIGDYQSYIDSLGTKRRDATFQSWQKTLNDVLFCIGTKLLYPLLGKLPSQIKRLIILPSSGLSLLPLHAISLSDGQLLCQRYCTSYAPSIQLLREMKTKAETIEGEGLYAVINPQEDPTLVFSGWQGQAISELFQFCQVDVGETATRVTVLNEIPGRAYLHFYCHGSYNWNNPLQSGLHLFGRTLSLADLQNDEVGMSSARLVTLSACETGITDIAKGTADEFVGLPAGFMLAGVPCVVSSLLSVRDVSTAILMQRFYSNHIAEKMDIPSALQEAQLWVRDLTSVQVADYVEKCYRSGKWKEKSKKFIEQYREHYLEMAKKSPEEKPFQHPYYWAAFTVNGA